MKNQEILYALSDIRADFIAEAAPARRRPIRRGLVAAVAAALAVVLMGAGVLFGDSVQSWMDHRWTQENGWGMGGEQSALVAAMSQEIGLSQTIGSITVDVDSAIFADQSFRVLVRVRGREFDIREGVCFDQWAITLDPDPTVGMGHGRGLEFAGIDGDGALLLWAWCYWDRAERPSEPFTVKLTLTDLVSTGAGGVAEEVLQAGTWEFEFPPGGHGGPGGHRPAWLHRGGEGPGKRRDRGGQAPKPDALQHAPDLRAGRSPGGRPDAGHRCHFGGRQLHRCHPRHRRQPLVGRAHRSRQGPGGPHQWSGDRGAVTYLSS